MSVRAKAIIAVFSLGLVVSALFATALLNAATFTQAAPAIVLFAASMTILACSAIIFSKKVLAPLEDNLKAVDRLAAGDYGAALENHGSDNARGGNEFGSLSAALGALSCSLRDESCRCRGFLQILPNSAMELDKRGYIIWLNDAAVSDAGFAGDRCLGRQLADFLAVDERSGFIAALDEAALSGSIVRREIQLHIFGAAPNRFQVICVPIIRDGNLTGWRCVVRDVEAMQKLQEELVRARNESQVTTEKLNKTISDLEEFALLAIRREFKMQELRERFVNIKHEHNLKKNITA
jgi:signal transduction histidine kinase